MNVGVIPKSERTNGEEEGNENWWDKTGISLKGYH